MTDSDFTAQPFSGPLPSPGVAPNAAPGCTITVNQYWLAYILGACHVFTEESVWLGDTATQQEAAQWGHMLLNLLADRDFCEELFQMEFIQYTYEVASGVAAPEIVAGVWNLRTINTIKFDTTGGDAALDANAFTCPPGRWLVYIEAVIWKAGRNQMRLKDSGANVVDVSLSHRVENVDSTSIASTLITLLENAAPEAYTLEHYTQSARGDGQGDDSSSGEIEKYLTVNLLKIGD